MKTMIRIEDTYFDRAAMAAASHRAADAHDLRPEGRYAVCLADPVEWLATFFALKEMGASVLPIHPATPRAAARALAVRAGCDTLILHGGHSEKLVGSGSTAASGELLQMSSGTTGAAKCIARPWSDVETEIESYVATFRDPEGMTPIVACPTTHAYGLICGLLVGIRRGATPVVVGTDNPKHLLKLVLETEKPLLYSSPAMLDTLARLMPEGRQVHAAMTSGTLLPEAWFARIRASATHLFQQYGCSEAGCIAINPDMRASEDMGYVLPHLALRDGGTAEEPAEIVIDAPSGEIRTRDLGFARDDGMLVFMARMDDTINVAGLNVYPQEVEDVVMAMPHVTDAVAFRKPDPIAGERVGLVLSASRPVPAQDVRRFCAERLARHQLPMEIVQIRTVPRQANGKISRREVAALHAAGKLAQVTAEDFHDA
jgi:3,4-dihydroxybenzoate---[aryl-carrier protein] ligase